LFVVVISRQASSGEDSVETADDGAAIERAAAVIACWDGIAITGSR
jgi:hypothetical protein